MSYLGAKSKENFEAGVMLCENNSHAASIHCFYYSCIQKIIQKIKLNLDMTEKTIRASIKDSKSGSHNWYINKITSVLKENSSEFYDAITRLKKMRVIADYKDENIDKEMSLLANNMSRDILNILEKGLK